MALAFGNEATLSLVEDSRAAVNKIATLLPPQAAASLRAVTDLVYPSALGSSLETVQASLSSALAHLGACAIQLEVWSSSRELFCEVEVREMLGELGDTPIEAAKGAFPLLRGWKPGQSSAMHRAGVALGSSWWDIDSSLVPYSLLLKAGAVPPEVTAPADDDDYYCEDTAGSNSSSINRAISSPLSLTLLAPRGGGQHHHAAGFSTTTTTTTTTSTSWPSNVAIMKTNIHVAQTTLADARACERALHWESREYIAACWELRAGGWGVAALAQLVSTATSTLQRAQQQLTAASHPSCGILGTAATMDASFSLSLELLEAEVRRAWEKRGEAVEGHSQVLLDRLSVGAERLSLGLPLREGQDAVEELERGKARAKLLLRHGADAAAAAAAAMPKSLSPASNSSSGGTPLGAVFTPLVTVCASSVKDFVGRVAGIEEKLAGEIRRVREVRDKGDLPPAPDHAWGEPHTRTAQTFLTASPPLRPPWQPRDGVPEMMSRKPFPILSPPRAGGGVLSPALLRHVSPKSFAKPTIASASRAFDVVAEGSGGKIADGGGGGGGAPLAPPVRALSADLKLAASTVAPPGRKTLR